MCMSSSSEAKPASPSSPANNSSGHASRDPSWLKLDVCPEYLSENCLRNEEDCPLAHPSSNVNIVEGTVTCCFDFIKVVIFEKEKMKLFGICFYWFYRTGPLSTKQLSLLSPATAHKRPVSGGRKDACAVEKSKQRVVGEYLCTYFVVVDARSFAGIIAQLSCLWS